MRRSTSASQACGSMLLSLAVAISVYMAAARSPPRSEPAKSQFLRPMAIARSFCPCRAGGRGPLPLARTVWRRLRRQYVERRAGGDVVHVEVTPGVVIVVAAWMLDPAACTGMSLGAPRVKLAALDVDQAAKAMRDEEMEAEIEDFLEGFNQPTYRGMRVNGVRVATWSSRDGRSGDTRPEAEWPNKINAVQEPSLLGTRRSGGPRIPLAAASRAGWVSARHCPLAKRLQTAIRPNGAHRRRAHRRRLPGADGRAASASRRQRDGCRYEAHRRSDARS
jgi:hypothetical protein